MTSKRFAAVLFRVALLSLVSGNCASVLSAQPSRSLTDRLKDVVSLTSLRSVSKPWHLKLDVTVVDGQGAEQQGSIESWRAGEESHTTTTFAGATVDEYEHANERYRILQGDPIPQVVTDVLDAVLHPGPESGELDGATPEIRMQDFGKTKLECIMLSRPFKTGSAALPATPPLGLFPTYCFAPQTDHLQLIYSYGNLTVVRTGIGKFLDHEISTAVNITDDAKPVARGKIVTLSTFTPAEGQFTPPAGTQPVGKPVAGLASGVIAGFKTGGQTPTYPASALMAHISGPVVLHAIIGTDGRIRRLTVKSAPAPDLAISALVTVRTWTYKPYLLNGEPVSVDTTITVNYNLSGGF